MASQPKTRLEHLTAASVQEIRDELARRRLAALRDCSEEELEEALRQRTLVSGRSYELPPRIVEK